MISRFHSYIDRTLMCHYDTTVMKIFHSAAFVYTLRIIFITTLNFPLTGAPVSRYHHNYSVYVYIPVNRLPVENQCGKSLFNT